MDIVTGDDVAIPVTLSINGVAVDLSGATIKANLVSKDHTVKFMLTDTAQSEAHPNADWVNGVVVIEFAAADTGAITEIGKCLIEIEVATPAERTWFVSGLKVVTGLVD